MSVSESASSTWGRNSKRRGDANLGEQLESAGQGFASLLRAASRKSSESLRSVKSAASRRKGSQSEGTSSRPSSRTTAYSDAPPVPRMTHYEKPMPSTPGSARPRGQSTSSYRSGRSENATPTQENDRNEYDAPRRSENRRRENGSMDRNRDSARTPTNGQADEDEVPPMASERFYGVGSAGNSMTSLSKSLRRGVPSSKKGGNSSQASLGQMSTGLRPVNEGRSTDDDYQFSTSKGDGNTIAQLYAVFGLPKDPSVWTLAEEDCVAGVQHIDGAVGRFWRPEVLGCSICPAPSEVLARASMSTDRADKKDKDSSNKFEGRNADGRKPQNPKFIEMADGRGGVERAETARVLSKALKLSFTREIEVISGQANFPPSATSHSFSFSVPTITSSGEVLEVQGNGADGRKAAGSVGVSVGKASAASAVGEGYGLERGSGATNAAGGFGDSPAPATFYGVVLTVWSAADERRTRTIKRELTRAARQRNGASKNTKRGNGWTGQEGDGPLGEEGAADEEGQGDGYSFLPAHNTFFMPYAICIVSRYPIYDLLGDWNKMAWHKYSRNIEMHNQQMATILRHPAPRLGEQIRIDSPTKELTFICTFPGALEWGTGLIGIDFTFWPVFKTLSLDNILSICEIALSPNGRILFHSRHPALLGLSVEAIKHLVELRGWRGVAHQNCHARDVRIYLEDPGSWIIAINSELRSLFTPAPEVCVVDLDMNYVKCSRPPKDAPSQGKVREKRRRKLATGINLNLGDYSPPRQYIEAYPGGRFRPLSKITLRERNSAYEQLEQPSWFRQGAVITAFDLALQDLSKSTFLQKVLKNRAAKAGAASEAELAAILALRRRASTFVDARDGLENKIGRLNKRLAFLMSESDMWKQQFSKIQQLVDRLTREANDLRSKVDKERRESRRLSSTLAQRDLEQVQIKLKLKETEDAREAAQVELLKMQGAMDSLESEREAMMNEIRAVIQGAGGEEGDFDFTRFDNYGQGPNKLLRPDSPTGSQVSQTASQQAESIMRHRTAAEARISEGRPSRSRNGHDTNRRRSLSQDGGERLRRHSPASSQTHHFPDDQMNREIQTRTSVVTDQISRIQQQLESTLTHLEGRRSGTYQRERDRGERRRDRRTSNASISSMRYEYGLPSSSERRERRAQAAAAPSAYKHSPSLTNLRQSISGSTEGSNGNSTKSPQAGQRMPSNPWKEAAEAAKNTDPAAHGNASGSPTSPAISTTLHTAPGSPSSPNGINGEIVQGDNARDELASPKVPQKSAARARA
ncbi:Calmodulin-binding protein CRAG, contains DENN domain [Ceraceosorus bombacis]|uniref:Calmodulin-binding protein CRAG, contains DENN domain n=1 Tax=Ceraceosorus bombacis TaxID=401625 RepID=A0A0P1BLL5_9BASI|nr:Calmodulin-binding protein CRAG, contains DENN domain [Ceraceosorus bombacis]